MLLRSSGKHQSKDYLRTSIGVSIHDTCEHVISDAEQNSNSNSRKLWEGEKMYNYYKISDIKDVGADSEKWS